MEMLEKLGQINNTICYIFHDVDMIPVNIPPVIVNGFNTTMKCL
jgi:hypothetical protein